MCSREGHGAWLVNTQGAATVVGRGHTYINYPGAVMTLIARYAPHDDNAVSFTTASAWENNTSSWNEYYSYCND